MAHSSQLLTTISNTSSQPLILESLECNSFSRFFIRLSAHSLETWVAWILHELKIRWAFLQIRWHIQLQGRRASKHWLMQLTKGLHQNFYHQFIMHVWDLHSTHLTTFEWSQLLVSSVQQASPGHLLLRTGNQHGELLRKKNERVS